MCLDNHIEATCSNIWLFELVFIGKGMLPPVANGCNQSQLQQPKFWRHPNISISDNSDNMRGVLEHGVGGLLTGHVSKQC